MTDLRKLAEAATPGPWRLSVTEKGLYLDSVDKEWLGQWSTTYVGSWKLSPTDRIALTERRKANAAYIAACSPERILALLDVVDRSRELNEARLNVSAALTGNIGDVLGLCAAEALHWDALRTALERLAASSRTGESG